MAVNCPKYRSEIPDDSRFCGQCSPKLTDMGYNQGRLDRLRALMEGEGF